MAWVVKDETNMVTFVRAARGKLEVDAPNRRINLTLYDGKSLDMREGRMILNAFTEVPYSLDFGQQGQPTFRPATSDMTSSQLWDELYDMERRLNLSAAGRDLSAEQLRARKRELAKLAAKDLTCRITTELPPAYRKIGRRLLDVSRSVQRRTLALATAYRLTGDAAFLRRAEGEMLAAAASRG